MIKQDPFAKPRVCLVIVTDGRDQYIKQTWDSWDTKLDFKFSEIIIIDDSARRDYQRWLDETFAKKVWKIVHHPERLGFGRTVADVWAQVPKDAHYVFHLEDDFLLNRPLDLNNWIKILQDNPKVVQVCAYRQPWSQDEINKGGFIKQHAGCYTDKVYSGFDVVEHKRNFSTNPSLYPRWLVDKGWPEDPNSEGKLSFALKEIDPEYVYLLWGKSTDEPLVHHFGQRRGTGY